MRIIAVINQKGGSGKTTTAVNLAAALGERGKRILVIDLDPQASTSQWLGFPEAGKGLLDVFGDHAELFDIIQATGILGIDLVPSSTWLNSIEKVLATVAGSETILQRKIKKLPKGRWDYIIMDCPPSLGLLAVNALAAAQEMLIPVEAHVMALGGVAQIITTAEIIRERHNPDLELTGVLACRVNARTKHNQEVIDELKRKFGKLVFKTVIRENIKLAEAPSYMQAITVYDGRSHGAEDYRDLASEVIKQERRIS